MTRSQFDSKTFKEQASNSEEALDTENLLRQYDEVIQEYCDEEDGLCGANYPTLMLTEDMVLKVIPAKESPRMRAMVKTIEHISTYESKPVSKPQPKLQSKPKKTLPKLAKPIQESETIEQSIDPCPISLHGKHILVADDDLRSSYAITQHLRQCGARITTAQNGKRALDACLTHSDIELIILDSIMPVMDGYEAMVAINQHARLGLVPIIIVTPALLGCDKEKYIDAGAVAVITKPVDRHQLFKAIKKITA